MSSASGWGQGGFGQGGFGGNVKNAAYYLNLFTQQYKNKPNFMAWVGSVLAYFDDLTSALLSFPIYFGLQTAIGSQLDILGTIVGVKRLVNFQPSNGVSPLLDDKTYRILIMATIGRNQWNGQLSSLQSLWKLIFPGGNITVVDSQNMTVTVFLSGGFTSIIKDLILNDYIIPRPQGVLMNYTFAVEPIFGFCSQPTSYIAGFGLGHFTLRGQ